jgi:hypothetical protein
MEEASLYSGQWHIIHGMRVGRKAWWKYYVHICANGKMEPVAATPGVGWGDIGE